MQLSPLTSIVAVACFACAASAQTILPVTSSWQLSLDNGQTWQGGTVFAPQSQTSVKVRNFVAWGDGVTLHPFNAALFDGVVRSQAGAGLNDSVANIRGVFNGFFTPAMPFIQGRRWTTDIIKIDGGDTQAPGQFPFVSLSSSPFTGTIFFGPASIFEYDLLLDGTAGSRHISAAWRIDAATGQPSLGVGLTTTPGPYDLQVTLQDATLVVVPSPAGLALVGVASGVLMRRRRS